MGCSNHKSFWEKVADTNSDPPADEPSGNTAEPAPDSLEAESPAPENTVGSSPADTGSAGSGENTADNSLDGNPDPQSPDTSAFSGANQPEKPSGPPNQSLITRLRRRVNIYTLLFILAVLIVLIILVVVYRHNHQKTQGQIKTQGLSQSTLDQLANNDVTVGNNQTVLKVQSSAIFAGQVLIRQGLEVAGNLQVGGTAAFSSIAVNGTSQLGQTVVSKDLAVSGNAAIQGTTTISKSLQVGGPGNFSGAVTAPQISTSSLQLNGDLTLTHHINTGGGQPSRSGGSALGGGGSVSLSGSDTAGAVTINTGSSPPAGCFVTVNFTAHYNVTPYVIVTPVGSAAGGLSYYVNRSTTSFSICDAAAPPAGSSFGFDYFVVD